MLAPAIANAIFAGYRQADALAAVRSHGDGMIAPPIIRGCPSRRSACLLINLGTPDAPEARAVRRYLAEFLSDPRVIEIPTIAWKPILHGIVLRTRPKKSAEAYNQVWTNEGSPLARHRRTPGRALRDAPRRESASIMRCATAIRASPRQSRTWRTKAARASSPHRSIRNIAQRRPRPRTMPCSRVLARMRWQPAMRTLPPYYDDPLYIEALAANLSRQLGALDFEPERLLLSFHGMPHADARARRSLSLPLSEDGAAPVARRSAATSMSRSSRASAGRNGWSQRRTQRSPLIRSRASSASRSPRRDSPPIASKRWRSSESGARQLQTRRRRAVRAARLPERFRPKASRCWNS